MSYTRVQKRKYPSLLVFTSDQQGETSASTSFGRKKLHQEKVWVNKI